LTHSSLLFGLNAAQRTAKKSLATVASRNFGIMQEYNERRNKKLINNFLVTDRPMYWVTSSRPSNFGDPIDGKTKADNWFDENRVWNEENRDYEVRRAQMYMVQGFILGNYILGVKTLVTMLYN